MKPRMKYRRRKIERSVWSVTEVYELYTEDGTLLGELWHSPPVEVKEPAADAGMNSWFCYFYKTTHNPYLWFGIPVQGLPTGKEHFVCPPQYGDGNRWIDAADALVEGRTETHRWLEYRKKFMPPPGVEPGPPEGASS